MDHHRKNRKQPSSSIKVERKIIEKNRRNHMKILFNNLFSLLPQHSTNPKEQGLTVADQIEETVEYIKSLDSKLKKSMEEKERLLMAIRNSRSTSFCKSSSSSPPKIEIGQVGSSLEIVLTSGLDYQFMFHEIICLIQQEGGEVLHANYSVLGNMIFHIVHAEISESKLGIGAAKIIREKLNKLVNGCMNDEEELWDIQIHNEMFGSERGSLARTSFGKDGTAQNITSLYCSRSHYGFLKASNDCWKKSEKGKKRKENYFLSSLQVFVSDL